MFDMVCNNQLDILNMTTSTKNISLSGSQLLNAIFNYYIRSNVH